jgi:dethiobiotin synthetase
MRGLFITGTDTGVGKTVVACGLVRGFVAQGLRVGVMKPIASGSLRTPDGLRNEDAVALIQASGVDLTYGDVNPYCFEPPISPHIAADEAKITIDLDMIAKKGRGLAAQSDVLIAEGAGGWLAPVGPAATMADLAGHLALPVLLVVGVKLGCLNHAALTRRAVLASGLRFAGWAASLVDPGMARPSENLQTLERIFGGAPLAVVAHAPEAPATLCLRETAAQLLRGDKLLMRLE